MKVALFRANRTCRFWSVRKKKKEWGNVIFRKIRLLKYR